MPDYIASEVGPFPAQGRRGEEEDACKPLSMCGLPSAENRENFAFLTKNFQENAVGHGVRMPEARRRDRGADRGCGRKPVGLTGVQAGVEAAGRNPCNGAWYGWNPGGVGGRILPRSCHPSGVPSMSMPSPRGSAALRPCLYSCVPFGDLCCTVIPPLSIFLRPLRGLQPCRVFLSVAADDFFSGTTYFGQESRVICY